MCLVQESERLGLVEIKGKGGGEGGGPESWGLSYAHEGGPDVTGIMQYLSFCD